MTEREAICQYQFGVQYYIAKQYSVALPLEDFQSADVIDWPRLVAIARTQGTQELRDFVRSLRLTKLNEEPEEVPADAGIRRVNHYTCEVAPELLGSGMSFGFCYYAKYFSKWDETHFFKEFYIRTKDGKKQVFCRWGPGKPQLRKGFVEWADGELVVLLGLEPAGGEATTDMLIRAGDYPSLCCCSFPGDSSETVPTLTQFVMHMSGTEKALLRETMVNQSIVSRIKAFAYHGLQDPEAAKAMGVSTDDLQLLFEIFYEAFGNIDALKPKKAFLAEVHGGHIWKSVK